MVAPVDGTLGKIGDRAATTFEAVLSFDQTRFDDPAAQVNATLAGFDRRRRGRARPPRALIERQVLQ